jgi:hypothetical protein
MNATPQLIVLFSHIPGELITAEFQTNHNGTALNKIVIIANFNRQIPILERGDLNNIANSTYNW